MDLAGDAFHVNGQPIRLQPASVPLAAALRTELRHRGVTGIRASLAPPKTDLRLLLRLFRPAPPPRLEERGDPARPFEVLRLRLGTEAAQAGLAERTEKLAEAYASAAAFVNQTIQQLRMGAAALPVRTAARIVQDLVDLQRSMPMRFLALARVKVPESDRYWACTPPTWPCSRSRSAPARPLQEEAPTTWDGRPLPRRGHGGDSQDRCCRSRAKLDEKGCGR